MQAIERKGVRIGEGMPKIIVPVMEHDAEGALRVAGQAVRAGADCIELRLDFLSCMHDSCEVSSVCRKVSSALPETLLLATFRSEGQGGHAKLLLDEYANLIRQVIAGGDADLVDIEIGAGDDIVPQLCMEAWDEGVIPVVSFHDFEGTPQVEELEGLLARMERMGAGICKFAVMANDVGDALRVMQATESYSHCSQVPLLTMAMGPAGGATRILGELFGSSMTFCALGRASAPGQVQIARARELMQGIHEISQ